MSPQLPDQAEVPECDRILHVAQTQHRGVLQEIACEHDGSSGETLDVAVSGEHVLARLPTRLIIRDDRR